MYRLVCSLPDWREESHLLERRSSMRDSIVSVLFLAAACGTPAAPANEPIDKHAGGGEPPGPSPTLTYTPEDVDASLKGSGLPAVADDGSRVVFRYDAPADGIQTYEALRVKDGADGVVHELKLLSDEFEAAEEPREVTQARIDEANEYLRETNETLRWRPMRALAVREEEEAESGERYVATGDDGVQVEYVEPKLTITVGGKVVLERNMPGWSEPNTPMCDDCEEQCSNPAFLGGAYIDTEREVALIVVQYYGTDSCWEPADRPFVVSW
jgi:hypothetical protein